MDILWTATSTNVKTGSVPTAWVGATEEDCRKSCAGCPLYGAGCYAHVGTPGLAAIGVRRVAARSPAKTTLRAALAGRWAGARMVRVSAIGDVGRCGKAAADAIVGAVRAAGLAVVGYTHHWREESVAAAWRGRLLASCETMADVDRAISEGWRASVVVPADYPARSSTPSGRPVVVCPAEVKPGVQCNQCRLCDAARPGPVIAFRAHGSQARKAAAHYAT